MNLRQESISPSAARAAVHALKAKRDSPGDIVAGDKGTGKTAIYRILRKNYRSYPILESVEIVDAFNAQGSPVFQRLVGGPELSEGQLRTFWKAYIFSLVGNFLIYVYGKNYNDDFLKLSDTFDRIGLASQDTSPTSIFDKLHKLIARALDPSAIQIGMQITENGMPIITPRIELGAETDSPKQIFSDDFLSILNNAAKATDLQYWVLFDRLDEAFASNPTIEIPALRALFRAYLDLNAFSNLQLKLFVRNDLFRKITIGGFVNLTHINARRINIVWEGDDLLDMVARRLRGKKEISDIFGFANLTRDEILSIILPPQIDIGDRKPNTKTWMMGRIRDGNGVRPPRKLIDLINIARDAQIRSDEREDREIDPSAGPLIEATSMKKSVSTLSDRRVQDTLLAEAAIYAPLIERFRDGKAEHNVSSLGSLFGTSEALREKIKALQDMGFLEQFGDNYKVPILYRDGLGITQGKAF